MKTLRDFVCLKTFIKVKKLLHMALNNFVNYFKNISTCDVI